MLTRGQPCGFLPRRFGRKDPPAAPYYASRDRASIQSGISRASSASCGQTLTAAIIGSTGRIHDPVRLSRRCAGATAGASSSNSPTSPPTRGGVRTPRRSRRSRWRRSNALTRCSPSSARSTASRPHAIGCAPGDKRSLGCCVRGLDARRARQTLAPCRDREGDRLHAHALAAIVPPLTALMTALDPKVARCSATGAQVVGDHSTGNEAVFLQELAH
jgi:hypothetical protein